MKNNPGLHIVLMVACRLRSAIYLIEKITWPKRSLCESDQQIKSSEQWERSLRYWGIETIIAVFIGGFDLCQNGTCWCMYDTLSECKHNKYLVRVRDTFFDRAYCGPRSSGFYIASPRMYISSWGGQIYTPEYIPRQGQIPGGSASPLSKAAWSKGRMYRAISSHNHSAHGNYTPRIEGDKLWPVIHPLRSSRKMTQHGRTGSLPVHNTGRVRPLLT